MVTGAGSGIGRALAQRLAVEKMSLALCDVNADRLDESAAEARLAINENVQRVTTHLVDVSDASRMREFADEVVSAHGRATLLINNAGVALHGRFEELSLEDFEWLMRINLWGVVNGTKAFLPVLRHERRAHIANLSSIFGIIAPAGQTAYAASKFAVRGFTEALRNELAGSNVGVSCVHPGGIRTRIAEDARMGANTPGSKPEYADAFARVARHSPEFAARKIVDGVKRNKARILIGVEAHALDTAQRISPARAASLLMGSLRSI